MADKKKRLNYSTTTAHALSERILVFVGPPVAQTHRAQAALGVIDHFSRRADVFEVPAAEKLTAEGTRPTSLSTVELSFLGKPAQCLVLSDNGHSLR